jgi:hypothetical protein
LLTILRTASAHGQSSQSTTQLITTPLTATGTGGATAGDTAVGLHTAPRTASGTGISGGFATYDQDPVSGITAGYWGIQALVS